MASENVFTVTDGNFDTEVINSAQPVLIDFWAVWCGPCRAIAPIVDQLATDYAGKVKIGKLDVDHNPKTAEAYGVASIPTLLMFKGGKVVGQTVGGGGGARGKIEELIKKAL